MSLSARELYRRGRAHLNAGRNAAARRDLARAEQRTDDPDLRARIMGSTAAVTIRQGDPDAAEAMCLEARALVGIAPRTAAMLEGQLGLLCLERGDLMQARRWLDRAIEGIGDEREHRAPMLLNRSLVHTRSGRYALAREDLLRAVPDYEATGNEVERAMAVHNAGYLALLEGDLVAALQTMAEARETLAGASAVNAAICDLDRAEVLRDAGQVADAERALAQVIRTFAAHRMPQARAEAEYHLARSLLLHSARAAAEQAAIAARRFRRVGGDWWALRADTVRLRALLESDAPDEVSADAGRVARRAARQAGDLLPVLEEHGLRGDAAALKFAVELWRARQGERSGIPIRVPRDAPIHLTMLAEQVRAARATSAGRGAEARRHAASGLEALAAWQSSFGSLDLATSLGLHARGLVLAGLGSAAQTMRADVVFEWAERARLLGQQSVPLRPPHDPALAADLTQLRALRADDDGDGWLASPRANELSEAARRRQWATKSEARESVRLDLDDVRALLDDETAALSYVYDGHRFVAVIARADGAWVVPIAAQATLEPLLAGLRAELDVYAAVRSGPMAVRVRQSLDDRLATLSDVLLGPVLRHAGERRLVLSVPGLLGGVPWALLPAMRGRVFTVAPSVAQWLATRTHDRPSTVTLVSGPRVPRAEEELEVAARAWREPTRLSGSAGTVTAVTGAAADADILHIASHGRHSADHPLFSGLELADGTLFGYDVDLIPRVPAIVVLSACEVGRSAVRGGEEAIGMTRVWLHAGSRCVVAAPVVVADDEACELLGAMHRGLAAGLAPSVALADAATRTGVIAPFQVHGAGF